MADNGQAEIAPESAAGMVDKEHLTDGRTCWCSPEEKEVEGITIVNHNILVTGEWHDAVTAMMDAAVEVFKVEGVYVDEPPPGKD
jgi:hypothetical protein